MSRPPRIKGFDYIGCYQVFLTICTHRRAPVFTEIPLVERITSHFLRTAQAHDVEITTYCVMPDHIHILATGLTDAADIATFTKLAKQVCGFEYRQSTGRHLWQDGFYDYVLRDEDATPSVMLYIVNNPLRAGLAVALPDYPFWGSQPYSRDEVLDYVQFVEPWVPPWKQRRV